MNRNFALLSLLAALCGCHTTAAAKKVARQPTAGRAPDATASAPAGPGSDAGTGGDTPPAGTAPAGETIAVVPPALPSSTVDNGIKQGTDVETLALACQAADQRVAVYLSQDFRSAAADDLPVTGTLIFTGKPREELWPALRVRAARDSDRHWTFSCQPLLDGAPAYVDLGESEGSVVFPDKTELNLACKTVGRLP